jgi:hypothetical protein
MAKRKFCYKWQGQCVYSDSCSNDLVIKSSTKDFDDMTTEDRDKFANALLKNCIRKVYLSMEVK